MSYRPNHATAPYSSEGSDSDHSSSGYWARTDTEENSRYRIELQGLKRGLLTIEITVRPTTLIRDIEQSIRNHTDLHLQESDSVYLYKHEEILMRTDRVGNNSHNLQYDVFPDWSNDYVPSTEVLTASSTPSSVGEAHVGIHPLPRHGSDDATTLAEVRRMHADRKGIKDPNALIVRLVGGLRPGPVEGNDWQLGRIADYWVPNEIVVTKLLRPSYLVLLGCGKEYLYQVPCADGDIFTIGRAKQWLADKLIRDVHHESKSQISVDPRDISLYQDDELLSASDTTFVEQTAKIGFRLPADIEKAFVADEAWLCPTSECFVCRERFRHKPSQVSESCSHKPSVCAICVGQWVFLCLVRDGWNKARCPECFEPLEYHEIKKCVSKQQFER